MAARCMKFNVDRADIGFAGLRAAIPGESQDRSIDRDFEGETPLKARDSSVARRSSASSFFGIVGLVRPRHDVAGATSTTGGSLFSSPCLRHPPFLPPFFLSPLSLPLLPHTSTSLLARTADHGPTLAD